MFLLVLVRLEAVQQLSVKTVSEGSVLVRWRGVRGVKGYRLICGPLRGQQEGSVVVPCLNLRTAQSFVLLCFKKAI